MYFKQTESTDKTEFEEIHHGIGVIKRRNLFGSSSHLPIQLEIWELAEGVSEGDHVHADSRPLEEIYYFLEGSGEMTINGELVEVHKNDAVMVPPGVNHGIRNSGNIPLKIIIAWGISDYTGYASS